MELPVLALELFVAGLAQDLLPAWQWLPVKIGFLTAVALWAALTKPALVALVAAVWAGAATDALGGLPMLCTSVFLLAMVPATRGLRTIFLEPNVWHGMLYVAVAAMAQSFWTGLWLSGVTPGFGEGVMRCLYSFPAGLIAGGVGFAWCGLMDRLSGSVKPVEEGNGILWSETDR